MTRINGFTRRQKTRNETVWQSDTVPDLLVVAQRRDDDGNVSKSTAADWYGEVWRYDCDADEYVETVETVVDGDPRYKSARKTLVEFMRDHPGTFDRDGDENATAGRSAS
jgi:hypothetical protein